MKKLFLGLFAAVFTLSIYSCRDTTTEAKDEPLEEVGNDIENAADEVGDEIDQAADEASDEIDQAAEEIDQHVE